MDPEAKAKWVAALRSGNYVQGQRCLKTPEGQYCCLGVIAEEMKFFGQSRDEGSETVKAPSGALGESQLNTLKLTSTDQWTLIGMNDDGVPFSVIADWIEANL